MLCGTAAPEGTLSPVPVKTKGEIQSEPDLKSPRLPPPLAKLFLQDNSIDLHSPCSEGSFDSVLCTRELKRYVHIIVCIMYKASTSSLFFRLLISSPVLEELGLDGNAIGDGGAREVLDGLQKRKEAGLPAVTVSVTCSVSPDLFAAINELTSAREMKKKGKKKGKKVSEAYRFCST